MKTTKLSNKTRFRFIAIRYMKFSNPTWQLKFQIRKEWDDSWDMELHDIINLYQPCKRLKYFK